jgi:hypothetical protein
MISVLLENKTVYHLMASMDEFASWVNGINPSAIFTDDFRGWVRKDGATIYLNRLSVSSASYLKESNE